MLLLGISLTIVLVILVWVCLKIKERLDKRSARLHQREVMREVTSEESFLHNESFVSTASFVVNTNDSDLVDTSDLINSYDTDTVRANEGE